MESSELDPSVNKCRRAHKFVKHSTVFFTERKSPSSPCFVKPQDFNGSTEDRMYLLQIAEASSWRTLAEPKQKQKVKCTISDTLDRTHQFNSQELL